MIGRPPPAHPAAAQQALRDSPRRHHLRASLLLLTFATGVIDAVSYLGVGSVFTANMTGNLVLIGFALGGTPGFSIVRTVAALLAFVAGAIGAGHLARHWHLRPFLWMQRVTGMLLIAFGGVAALLGALPDGRRGDDVARLVIVVILGVTMGLLNATVRRLEFRDIPTTVATSTISDLASESRWGGGERRNQRDRILAITAMLAGALLGAALVQVADAQVAFMLALVAVLAAAGHQRWVAGRYPGMASEDEPPGP